MFPSDYSNVVVMLESDSGYWSVSKEIVMLVKGWFHDHYLDFSPIRVTRVLGNRFRAAIFRP